MFVYNLKVKPSKKLAVFFAVASLAAGIMCIICMTAVHNKASDTATCDELGTYFLTAKNTSEQCQFLEQFGYKANSKSMESREVVIPTKFNKVYEDYNSLQKSIGLDLGGFRGVTAQEVRFELKNSETKYAVLLIYNEKVIGAHLTNGEYGQSNLPLK